MIPVVCIKTAGMVHMKCDMAEVVQFLSDAINCGLKIAYKSDSIFVPHRKFR
jgi:hypothetical protein